MHTCHHAHKHTRTQTHTRTQPQTYPSDSHGCNSGRQGSMFSEALALSRFKQPVMESKHSSNKHPRAHVNTYNNTQPPRHNAQTHTHMPTNAHIRLACTQLFGIVTIVAMIVIIISGALIFDCWSDRIMLWYIEALHAGRTQLRCGALTHLTL